MNYTDSHSYSEYDHQHYVSPYDKVGTWIFKEQIQNFGEKESESLYTAWERYKGLLHSIPHNVYNDFEKVGYFLTGISQKKIIFIDMMFDGKFFENLKNKPTNVLNYLDHVAKMTQYRDLDKEFEIVSIPAKEKQFYEPVRYAEGCGLGTIGEENSTDSYEYFSDSESDKDEGELQKSLSDIDPPLLVGLLETPSLALPSCVEMTQEEPIDAWLTEFKLYDLHTETSMEKASPMDGHFQEVELEPLSTSCTSLNPFIESPLIPVSPTGSESFPSELDDRWHVQWDESEDVLDIQDEEESVSIVQFPQLEQDLGETNQVGGWVPSFVNPPLPPEVELTREEHDFLDSSTVGSFHAFLESEWNTEPEIQCPPPVSVPNLFDQEMDTMEEDSSYFLREPDLPDETIHWSLALEKLTLVEVEHIDFLGVDTFDVVYHSNLINLVNNLKINLVRIMYLLELKFLKRIRLMIYSKYLFMWHGRIQYLTRILGRISLFILTLIAPKVRMHVVHPDLSLLSACSTGE